jgi:nucleotide-binding universal stress UspA family protein
MFTTILAATDKPALADPSVLTAMQLAKQTNAGLHIMHVLEPLQTDGKPLVRHFQTGQPVQVDSAYKASVREEIIRSYSGLLADIGDFDIAVSVGIPWHEILEQVKKSKAELIVMGPCAQGVRGDDCVTKEAGIGDTLEAVWSRAKSPVLIANNELSEEKKRNGSVLVGIDFSKSCEAALVFASRLAKTFRARLVLFHMIPVPPIPKYSQADYQADIHAAEKRLQKFSRAYIEGVDHDYCICAGVMAHEEILVCAQQHDADILVMGSHTKNKEGKWSAGSVVKRVLQSSKYPLIVLSDPDVLKPWEADATIAAIQKSDADRTVHAFSRKQE